jgi:UDP-galactopyranose mutase
LASQQGDKVLVLDRRSHTVGNAYGRHDGAGVLMHQYGPLILHTNAQSMFDYSSNFTESRHYNMDQVVRQALAAFRRVEAAILATSPVN